MKTILLVEDEVIVSLAEAETVEGFGYRVLRATDGERAVELACGDANVDLVLMDIDLGQGIDGTEAARRILARRDLPIVFLTAHEGRECVEKVRGITRYGYVIKEAGDCVLQSSIEMAFDLFEARERSRASEAKLATLIRTIPDLVWLKDGEGVYLACNPAFERFFGAPAAEIVGKTDYDFVSRELADFFLEKDRKAIERGGPSVNEEEITFADDGHRADLETIKTPMIDASGKIIGVLGIGRDITRRKKAEEDLKESEARVQRKLRALVEPDGQLGELELRDIVDVPTIQALMEDFTKISGMVTALLDTEGRILVATGWRDICTKFHRACPESAAACTASDLFLATNLKEGEHIDYKCGNGLWDVVTPLYVEGRHLGNIYSGQYFYEDDVVDPERFSAQAARYGFDEAAYLEALSRVSRTTRESVATLMEFLDKLTMYISRLSYSNLRLAKATAELKRTDEQLSRSVAEKEILFRELQHRVKNSLSLVSSLLRLSQGDIKDEAARRIFGEAIDRVQCVGSLYERLRSPSSIGEISLDSYLSDLANLLLSSYSTSRGDLAFVPALEPMTCDPGKAASIGLIFNELFTNALKYAYRDEVGGEIRVSLRRSELGGELRIEDRGPGFPPGFDLEKAESLGLRIAGLLAKEIGGSLELSTGAGAVAILKF